MEEFFHALLHSSLHALLDLLKTVPFLFLAYLLMEFIEHKASEKMEAGIKKIRKCGPVVGTGLGLVPQCGFSASCANFYTTGLITEGTLIAVFLATSDEALPILLANPSAYNSIWKFIVAKIIIGIIIGFGVDIALKLFKVKKSPVDLCENCGCDEEKGILLPALKHTLKTGIFLLIISIILGVIIELLGEENLNTILLSGSYAQPFITALLGLVPNCAVSVALIELYIAGSLSFGSTLAGLCSGAGVGLAVLLKSNKNKWENIRIITILYLVSSIIGFVLMIFNV